MKRCYTILVGIGAWKDDENVDRKGKNRKFCHVKLCFEKAIEQNFQKGYGVEIFTEPILKSLKGVDKVWWRLDDGKGTKLGTEVT